jgi:hypothetical protein
MKVRQPAAAGNLIRYCDVALSSSQLFKNTMASLRCMVSMDSTTSHPGLRVAQHES